MSSTQNLPYFTQITTVAPRITLLTDYTEGKLYEDMVLIFTLGGFTYKKHMEIRLKVCTSAVITYIRLLRSKKLSNQFLNKETLQ
jgi:hypothetical protein